MSSENVSLRKHMSSEQERWRAAERSRAKQDERRRMELEQKCEDLHALRYRYCCMGCRCRRCLCFQFGSKINQVVDGKSYLSPRHLPCACSRWSPLSRARHTQLPSSSLQPMSMFEHEASGPCLPCLRTTCWLFVDWVLRWWCPNAGFFSGCKNWRRDCRERRLGDMGRRRTHDAARRWSGEGTCATFFTRCFGRLFISILCSFYILLVYSTI